MQKASRRRADARPGPSMPAVVARRGQMMPKLVERELDGYVGCGVLARGFARVRCGACGHELLVRCL